MTSEDKPQHNNELLKDDELTPEEAAALFHSVFAELEEKEDGVNPKDLIGDTKPDLSLVPPAAVIYMALAMGDGAKKYGPYNWREKKVRCRVYLAACLRHIQQFLDGEELAEDSGRPHLGHALACLGIVVDAKETGNLVDDRPIPGAASDLIKRYTVTKQ